MENEIKLSGGCSGMFNIVVLKEDGSVKKDYGWQSNMITDLGLSYANKLTTSISDFRGLRIGIGSGDVKATDTALFEHLITNSSPISFGRDVQYKMPNDLKEKLDAKYPDGYHYARIYGSWRNAGIKNQNITEVGLYSTNSGGGSLTTHALIRDENGSPTAISILEGEVLVVNYNLFFVVPYQIKRGSFVVRKTPDLANPDQYEEIIYDYQYQNFELKDYKNVYLPSLNAGVGPSSSLSFLANHRNLIVDEGSQSGDLDFEKWKMPFLIDNSRRDFEEEIKDDVAYKKYFPLMDLEYKKSNVIFNFISDGATWAKSDSELANSNWFYCLNEWGNILTFNPFKTIKKIRGYFTIGVPSGAFDYNSTGFPSTIFLKDISSHDYNIRAYGLFLFSRRGTGEGLEKPYGYFLRLRASWEFEHLSTDDIILVTAKMDTSNASLVDTFTLDLTHEDGATFEVNVVSTTSNVEAANLVSVNGLTLTRIAESGTFYVDVVVHKEGKLDRKFRKNFTIATN